MDSAGLTEVARRHGVRLVLQFGSTVTGRERPGSDLDLAVLLDHSPTTFAAHAELVEELQALCSERQVDVAIVNRADPLLLKQITDHCRLLYGAARDLHELKLYAFKRYQDHRPYFAMERRYVKRAIDALAS